MTIERIPFLRAEETAFFFDLDGTLAPIVDNPADVAVSSRVLQVLAMIVERAEGAVAVVSGRSIATLDAFLEPLKLPLAGVHGMERRRSDGSSDDAKVDAVALRDLSVKVAKFCSHHPGLLFEEKPGSVALHYRTRPDLASACLIFAEELACDSAVRVLPGKMVFEFKLGTRTKAQAIEGFMTEIPFAGRTPFFVGDDVTDEFGFVAVEQLGGIGVKIGPEETKARYRFETIDEFHLWLMHYAETFSTPSTSVSNN